MRLAWSFLSSCLSCLQGFPVANIVVPLRLVLSSFWKGRPQRPFCTHVAPGQMLPPFTFPLAFSKSNSSRGESKWPQHDRARCFWPVLPTLFLAGKSEKRWHFGQTKQ
jgi:hypothetical protein